MSGNTAGFEGGGIYAFGTVIVTNSTVSGNTAASSGGGIVAGRGLTLSNSTVSGNTAGTFGGGISFASNNKARTIRNSTIALNKANQGGGFYIFDFSGSGDDVNLGNTIVAKNTATTSQPDIGSDTVGVGYINSGNNLIGINTGFEVTFPTSSLVGTAGSPVNPLLGPLQNNGGLTQTHALLVGSPAINAGNNALIPMGVTTDQRGTGFPRISGGTVDIGAFEVQVKSPPTPVMPVNTIIFNISSNPILLPNEVNIILQGTVDVIFSQLLLCDVIGSFREECIDDVTFTTEELTRIIE